MKLSTLQGWYRAHGATGDAASAEAALATLGATDDSNARDAAIEQLLASDAGAASLKLAAAVQSDAAEAGVALAQADWRERRLARRPQRSVPTWAPYALAASVALFVLGVAQVRRPEIARPASAPIAEHPAAQPSPARPMASSDDVIFIGKLDEEPIAANAAAQPKVLFRDDFGS